MLRAGVGEALRVEPLGLVPPRWIETRTLHWLDVYSKGQLDMNNVASWNSAIQTIVPNLITYFGSGTGAAMYELAALDADE